MLLRIKKSVNSLQGYTVLDCWLMKDYRYKRWSLETGIVSFTLKTVDVTTAGGGGGAMSSLWSLKFWLNITLIAWIMPF